MNIRARLRAWALRRQGIDQLPTKLAARRIYIVPTAAGWTFGMLIGVMFIAGTNYGNGLALLFTFWLAGFAFVAMVRTQRSLAGTEVLGITAASAFAGGKVELKIAVAGRAANGDLRLVVEDGAATTIASDEEDSAGVVTVEVPAPRRGRLALPPLRISSTAPFGLFHTWTWLRLDSSCVVYPRAAGTLPVPESAGEDGGSAQLAAGQDELAWLRDFREGDSPRQVAWKAYARGQPLLVREYRGAAARRHDFDFTTLTGLGLEARLSQLARWVVDAASRGEQWVLRLPEAAPMEGSGIDHRDACLTSLALYGLPGEPR